MTVREPHAVLMGAGGLPRSSTAKRSNACSRSRQHTLFAHLVQCAPAVSNAVSKMGTTTGVSCAMGQVNAGFFYSSADQREKLVAAERAVVDARVAEDHRPQAPGGPASPPRLCLEECLCPCKFP